MILCENVTFHYPGVKEAAIQSMSLEIQDGESIAVMGANGSGKSTFAKLLGSLLKPERGKISLNRHSKNLPVGFIFQNPDNQMVAMTVEKELAFTLENLGIDPDIMEQKISETLEQFNLSHLRNSIISDLSGGEKQKVAIASVMIYNPNILILDEPDSFLDRQGQRILMDQIEKIKRENEDIIIIHITQYPEIAKKYQRLLVFHKGEIAADASPDKIFSNISFIRQTGLSFEKPTLERISPDLVVQKSTIHSSKKIQINNLRFGYVQERILFDDLSAEIKRGEITGVVGASGSGKSTLAAILCTLIPPQSGTISLVSNDSKANELTIRQITAILQQPERQFFLSNVGEEVRFGPKNAGKKLSQEDIIEYLSLVGLDYKKLSNRDPQTLSGGEKRRLAFASALAMGTDYLIFDEPTCGLDPQGVGLFLALAEQLKLLHKGIIIISHDGGVISRLSDSILVLSVSGKSRQTSKQDFLDDPVLSQLVTPTDVI